MPTESKSKTVSPVRKRAPHAASGHVDPEPEASSTFPKSGRPSEGSAMSDRPFRLRTVRVHGHDVTYRMAGEGPTVVLIHGIAGSSTTWRAVMPALAEHYTVIAPDLLGHGQSAKPRGDYSLGVTALSRGLTSLPSPPDATNAPDTTGPLKHSASGDSSLPPSPARRTPPSLRLQVARGLPRSPGRLRSRSPRGRGS